MMLSLNSTGYARDPLILVNFSYPWSNDRKTARGSSACSHGKRLAEHKRNILLLLSALDPQRQQSAFRLSDQVVEITV